MTRRSPIPLPTYAADEGPAYRYWGNQKPPKNALILCQATPRVSADATKATIRMYGPIDPYGGFWGTSAKEVAQALDDLADTVTELQLRINSPGGSCFEALAILNLLRAHPVAVTAVVDGLAASAASLIAAGCDETVMSPGSQMMVHGPSGLCWGMAGDMRDTADVLDKIAASMASIYVEAAGGKTADWVTLMQKDTWYTAEETVEAGLADRVAVVPDAGQTTTAGADPDDDEVDPLEEDDPEALAQMYRSILEPAASTRPTNPRPRPRTGPTTPEGAAVVDLNDQQIAALREQVGFAEDADADTIVAAVAEALAEQAEPSTPTAQVPAGMTLIESDVLGELREGATAGRAARDQLAAQARDAAISAAVKDGKITPARRDHWLKAWGADPDGTKATLDSLEPGLVVPTAEAGTAGEPESQDIDPQTAQALDAYAASMGIPKEALRG